MALFDALLNKVRYTADAITAIGEAANAKGANIQLDIDPLAVWPEKINAIATGSTLGMNFRGPVVTGTSVKLGTMPFPFQIDIGIDNN